MDGETIAFFGQAVGKMDEISAITKRAMAGELDFYESLKERVKFLKGVEVAKIEQIAHSLPFIKGAEQIIKYLKEKGILVAVFSGGFHIATDHAQSLLGFDINFANELHRQTMCKEQDAQVAVKMQRRSHLHMLSSVPTTLPISRIRRT